MDLNSLDENNRRWSGVYGTAFEIDVRFSGDFSVLSALPSGVEYNETTKKLSGVLSTTSPEGTNAYTIRWTVNGTTIETELRFYTSISLTFDPILEDREGIDISEFADETTLNAFRSQPMIAALSPHKDDEIELGGNLYYTSIVRDISRIEFLDYLPPGLIFDSDNWTIEGIPRATGFWQTQIRVHHEDSKTASPTYGGGNQFVVGGSYVRTLSFNFGNESDIPVAEQAPLGTVGQPRGIEDESDFLLDPQYNFHPTSLGAIVFEDDDLDMFFDFPSEVCLVDEEGNDWPLGTIFYPAEQKLKGSLTEGTYEFKVRADWEDRRRGYSIYPIRIDCYPADRRPPVPPENQTATIHPGYFLDEEPTVTLYSDIPFNLTVDYGNIPEANLMQIHRMDFDGATPTYGYETTGAGYNLTPASSYCWVTIGIYFSPNPINAVLGSLQATGYETRVISTGPYGIMYVQAKKWAYAPHSYHSVAYSSHLPQNVRTVASPSTGSLIHGQSFEGTPAEMSDNGSQLTLAGDDWDEGDFSIPFNVSSTIDWLSRSPAPIGSVSDSLDGNGVALFQYDSPYWNLSRPIPYFAGGASNVTALYYQNDTFAHNVRHQSIGRVNVKFIPFPYNPLPPIPEGGEITDVEYPSLTPFNYDPIRRVCYTDLSPTLFAQPQLLPHAIGGMFLDNAQNLIRPANFQINGLMDAVWLAKKFRLDVGFDLVVSGGQYSGGISENIDWETDFWNHEIRNHPTLDNYQPTTVDDHFRSPYVFVDHTEADHLDTDRDVRYILEWLKLQENDQYFRTRRRQNLANEYAPLLKFNLIVRAQDDNDYTVTTHPGDGRYELPDLKLNFMGVADVTLYGTEGAHYLNGSISITETEDWLP